MSRRLIACATIALPQNGQRAAVTLGLSVVSAPQVLQRTASVSTSSSGARLLTVCAKSISSTRASAGAAISLVVPQYGQTRELVPGANCRLAPQFLQGNWR